MEVGGSRSSQSQHWPETKSAKVVADAAIAEGPSLVPSADRRKDSSPAPSQYVDGSDAMRGLVLVQQLPTGLPRVPSSDSPKPSDPDRKGEPYASGALDSPSDAMAMKSDQLRLVAWKVLDLITQEKPIQEDGIEALLAQAGTQGLRLSEDQVATLLEASEKAGCRPEIDKAILALAPPGSVPRLAAERCNAYINETLRIRAPNRGDGGDADLAHMRREKDAYIAALTTRWPERRYHTSEQCGAYMAKRFGVGQCGEFSQLAFVWMAERGIRPLDRVEYDEGGPTLNSWAVPDHAVVVIGRTQGEVSDRSSWNRSIWLLDTHAKRFYRVSAHVLFSSFNRKFTAGSATLREPLGEVVRMELGDDWHRLDMEFIREGRAPLEPGRSGALRRVLPAPEGKADAVVPLRHAASEVPGAIGFSVGDIDSDERRLRDAKVNFVVDYEFPARDDPTKLDKGRRSFRDHANLRKFISTTLDLPGVSVKVRVLSPNAAGLVSDADLATWGSRSVALRAECEKNEYDWGFALLGRFRRALS